MSALERLLRLVPPRGAITRELAMVSQEAADQREREVLPAQLSNLSEDLGLLEQGEFRAGNGVEPGTGFTGIRMGYPAFTYAGLDWHIVGVKDDVMMFGLNADDGKAYAGGGVVVLDDSGVTIATGTGDVNKLKYYNGSDLQGEIYTKYGIVLLDDIVYNVGIMYLNAYGTGSYPGYGTDPYGVVHITSFNHDGSSAHDFYFTGNYINVNHPAAIHHYPSGQQNQFLEGQVATAVSYANTSSAKDIIAFTIAADQLVQTGWIHIHVAGEFYNNSGTRTFKLTYNFGGYSLSTAADSYAATTKHYPFTFDVWTYNDQATGAQKHIYRYAPPVNVTAETWGTEVSRVSFGASTEDTTAAVDVSVTGTMSIANSAVSFTAFASADGPYYGT